MLTNIAAQGRLAMSAAVEGDVGAQITAGLDAGIEAGDVESPRRRATDLHILDGLYRKDRQQAPLMAISPAAVPRIRVRTDVMKSPVPTIHAPACVSANLKIPDNGPAEGDPEFTSSPVVIFGHACSRTRCDERLSPEDGDADSKTIL